MRVIETKVTEDNQELYEEMLKGGTNVTYRKLLQFDWKCLRYFVDNCLFYRSLHFSRYYRDLWDKVFKTPLFIQGILYLTREKH